jgi:hypothetical protein
MAVPLNRRTPPADTAAKALAIARSGRWIGFTGELRRLGSVYDLLAGQPGVWAILSGQQGAVRLLVFPEDRGGFAADRV